MLPAPSSQPGVALAGRVRAVIAACLAAGGVLLLAVAVVGLREDWSLVAQPFYAWVWWGYILLLDAFAVWKRGSSLLTTRRQFVVPLCVWSISFWFFFELINARIQNWYYVGVYPVQESLAGSVFTLFAFATVFMGIFETCDALGAAGAGKNLPRGKPRPLSSRTRRLIQTAGIAVGAAALVFPHYLAPLVWGSFTLIVDPINRRRGARSILGDIETGAFGPVVRLLAAGLICGVVWESLNFAAPQKWIYTVRGLEELKLFEMPLLGFIGFPALALDSMAAFSLLSCLFLGGRTWEHPDDVPAAEPPAPRPMPPARLAAFRSSIALHVIFWIAVAGFATPVNVGSIKLELADLGLTESEIAALRNHGISRPRQLGRALESESFARSAAPDLAWSDARTARIRERTRLYTFKGIGAAHGRLLETIGVTSPEAIADWSADDLHRKLQRAAAGTHPPRLDFVRAWIVAARSDGRILTGVTLGSTP